MKRLLKSLWEAALGFRAYLDRSVLRQGPLYVVVAFSSELDQILAARLKRGVTSLTSLKKAF